MSNDLDSLTVRLRTQLTDLLGSVDEPVYPSPDGSTKPFGVDFMNTFEDPEAGSRIREIIIRLTPDAAEALAQLLDNHLRDGETQSG